MRTILWLAFVTATSLNFASQAFAQPVKVKSPRSDISLVVGKMNNEGEVSLVKIREAKQQAAHFLIDKNGITTTIIPQEFSLRVIIWRPSKEIPHPVVVLQKQKEGIETELIDAVVLDVENVRFLNNQLFRKLQATQGSIPDVQRKLKGELNDLIKRPIDKEDLEP